MIKKGKMKKKLKKDEKHKKQNNISRKNTEYDWKMFRKKQLIQKNR